MTEQEFLEVLSNILITDEEAFMFSDDPFEILNAMKDKVEQRKMTLKLNKIK